MPIPVEVAAAIPLFQGLDKDTLATVARLMTVKVYESQDLVLRKGDAPDNLAFLISGKLQVVDLSEDGRETGIHFILPGVYFGELSVIDGQPRSASVKAIVTSEVGLLPAASARALIVNRPIIAERFLTHFAKIVRASSSHQTLLSIPSAYQRVFAQLLQFVRDTAQGKVIEGLPKQHEIAIMVNTSRETVSRALHTLMRMNIVEKRGGVLIVHRPEQLKVAATAGLDEAVARVAEANKKKDLAALQRAGDFEDD